MEADMSKSVMTVCPQVMRGNLEADMIAAHSHSTTVKSMRATNDARKGKGVKTMNIEKFASYCLALAILLCAVVVIVAGASVPFMPWW